MSMYSTSRVLAAVLHLAAVGFRRCRGPTFIYSWTDLTTRSILEVIVMVVSETDTMVALMSHN